MGSVSILYTLLTGFFNGLSLGFSVLTARFYESSATFVSAAITRKISGVSESPIARSVFAQRLYASVTNMPHTSSVRGCGWG